MPATETFTVPPRLVPSNRAAADFRPATLIGVRPETATMSTFRFAVPDWPGHAPGQHVMVRLTAADGYTAQRHYSLASTPGDAGYIELTVDHMPGGEVSGHLHTVAKPGDTVEIKGPLGGFFAWPGDRPALLLGGGSGVVPLMSMLRHHREARLRVPLRLVVSVRSPENLPYSGEFGAETTVIYTRTEGRLHAGHLRAALAETPTGGWEAYVCGGNGFTEHASRLLVAGGQPRDRVRVERFG
ncbi:ferredoxin reductase [Nocardia aurantia]|uniref:Propane 2-monooxygenase, reductase component n=1 Tax=Nocardia aurantia TaxID=2585199 RepID=A0A7K0DWH4_9NOCA|nr:ferredoxin reductase [Nocardia aurantia]MQY30126.1 Propane 2-monooxygenase, reductase component [Nocardia aurantia]